MRGGEWEVTERGVWQREVGEGSGRGQYKRGGGMDISRYRYHGRYGLTTLTYGII